MSNPRIEDVFGIPRSSTQGGKAAVRPHSLNTSGSRNKAKATSSSPLHRASTTASIDSVEATSSLFKIAAALLKKQKLRESDYLETAYEQHSQNHQEPSYRLLPSADGRFSQDKVREVVSEVIQKYAAIEDAYDPKRAKRLAVGLAEVIKMRVKDLEFERYKLVVQVFVGELRDQGIEVSSRALADESVDDNCVIEVQYPGKKFFITALVFGIYLD